MLPVIFRVDKLGEVEAFFPTLQTGLGFVTCYAHNGQHGEALYEYYRDDTVPARKEEYEPLLKELQSIGYNNLKVCSRWSRKYKI